MGFLAFGFAVGAFISGLIEYFYKEEVNKWIKPTILFSISALCFLVFLYLEWQLISQALHNLFS